MKAIPLKLLSSLFLFFQLSAFAAPEDQLPADEFDIKDAIVFGVTPKGLKTVGTQLSSILEANGVNIFDIKQDVNGADGEGLSFSLPTMATSDFSNNPKTKKTINDVIKNLERFIIGFKVNDHQFDIGIEDIVVEVKLNDLQVEVQNVKDREIVLFFKTKLEKIQLDVKEVNLKDNGNPFLGEFKVQDFELKIDRHVGEALELGLGIQVSATQGGLKAKVLGISDNISKILPQINYNKINFDIPPVYLHINGQDYPLNVAELKVLLEENEPALVETLKGYLEENLGEVAPGFIDKLLDQNLGKISLQNVNLMNPPGAGDSAEEVEPFLWGINSTQLDIRKGNLIMGLDAFLSDEQASGPSIVPPAQTAKIEELKQNVEDLGQDLFLAFSLDFFNQVIGASYARGYFAKFPLNDEEEVSLTRAPVIKVDGQGRGKMKLYLDYCVKGIAKIAVKNPLSMELDLVIDVAMTPSGLIELKVLDIDMDSIYINKKKEFRWPFRNIGYKQAVKKLQNSREGLMGNVLAKGIEIPSELLGLKWQNSEIKVDKSGYFVVYSNLTSNGNGLY